MTSMSFFALDSRFDGSDPRFLLVFASVSFAKVRLSHKSSVPNAGGPAVLWLSF
jgi:hypothetical protein